MPKHKIQRQEEVNLQNWQRLLELASTLDFSKSRKVPKLKLWLCAVIAIDWLTGKRINEILKLKRSNITLADNQIKIRFHIGKKRSRGEPIKEQPYQKNRTIEHKAVPYILAYLKEFDEQNSLGDTAHLFPANSKPRFRTVHTRFINGRREKEIREYTYRDEGGYVYEENARYWLTLVNEQLPVEERIYFHYGRHSIGIKLAYQGKSNIEIAKILDETPRAALAYTAHAGGLGEAWTQETE